MTIGEKKKEAENLFKLRGTVDPCGSAEAIFCFSFGWRREELYASTRAPLGLVKSFKINNLIKRRLRGEPVSQIVGRVNFVGHDFVVNRNVLTPRPESELLINEAVELFASAGNKKYNILDIGTGSGVLICSLALRGNDDFRYFASDVSGKALKVARKNISRLNLSNKIEVRQGSLFDPWEGKKFNLIITNLPYVPAVDRDSLDRDVVHFEPEIALFSGPDGLDLYRDFIRELPNYLLSGGVAICEIGNNQGPEIKKLVKQCLPGATCIIKKDLAMIDRVAIIKLINR